MLARRFKRGTLSGGVIFAGLLSFTLSLAILPQGFMHTSLGSGAPFALCPSDPASNTWLQLVAPKENSFALMSANCSSKFSNLIVLASNLGGVPVFNLPILKSYFSNCSLKPVEGFSSYLPAGNY